MGSIDKSMTEVCRECRNYFLKDYITPSRYIHSGEYTISNGEMTDISFLKSGQFFRITGSDLNDGVYQNTPESLSVLKNETFDGAVWAMSVPPDFADLCSDIAAWRVKYESIGSMNLSPFSSESISGVYSYTKSSGGAADGSGGITWKSQFANRIRAYRRVSEL